MITTNDQTFYERSRRFRNHGQSEKTRYIYEDIGYNYRMPDVLSAIGVVQMSRVEDITKKRQGIAAQYNKAFKNIKGLVIPQTAADRTHVFHQYTLRVTSAFKKSRDELKEYLTQKQIGCNIFYPKPLYEFPHLGHNNPQNYPVTQQAVQEVISIPVHPQLTEENIKYIIETICNV
jgi:perosamine synthetase